MGEGEGGEGARLDLPDEFVYITESVCVSFPARFCNL